MKDERNDVEQRLATQRAAVDLLHNQKVSVLEVLELVEKVARGAQARADRMALELRALQRRTAVAQLEESVARAQLEAQLQRLKPRLAAMYRLSHRGPLDALLSAEDFAGMVWRARAMSRLLDSDLTLLRQVQEAEAYQQRAVAELAALRASTQERLEAVKRANDRAAEQKRDLAELVELIQAETTQSTRLIRDLEQSDRDLTELIDEMDAAPATSGFGALRGKLPLPTSGRIEVGFGKVVNPKFNTVTIQKGVDIRAPEGTPVKAVGPGKVAYAGWLRGYGNMMIVDHGDGFFTLMAHLAQLGRAVGDAVAGGDVLGTVGDTGSLKGPYLYFELRQKGRPVDPALWLEHH